MHEATFFKKGKLCKYSKSILIDLSLEVKDDNWIFKSDLIFPPPFLVGVREWILHILRARHI